MTISDVKSFIYELVTMYYPSATVVWAKTNGVTPKPPYIVLSYGNLNKTTHPVMDDDGIKWYACSIMFEINLYTTGKRIKVDGMDTGTFENTATEDLEEFVRFLDSDAILNLMQDKNITFMQNSPITDLSQLIGDTKFNYRSMTEFIIYFYIKADGEYGIFGKTMVPSASGGGTQEMAEAITDVIEEVEIIEGGNDRDEE